MNTKYNHGKQKHSSPSSHRYALLHPQSKDTLLTRFPDKECLEPALPPPNNPTQGSRSLRSLHRLLTSIAPQSPQEKLERFFDNRPSPTDLKQRNILKTSNVAPSLQGAQASLPSPPKTYLRFDRQNWSANVSRTNYPQNSPFAPNQTNSSNNTSSLVLPHPLVHNMLTGSRRGPQPGASDISPGKTYKVL